MTIYNTNQTAVLITPFSGAEIELKLYALSVNPPDNDVTKPLNYATIQHVKDSPLDNIESII